MRHPVSDPLDERLVEVSLAILEEEGLEHLTLRHIARRAGVSHGAPLRHYSGLADLLGEVAACGFAILSEATEKASAQMLPGAGPVARLRAAGRGYVEAAVAHPALFTLMFRSEALDFDNQSLARESARSFEQLVRHVRAAQDAGWNPERETRALAGSVWASVHGLAILWAQGPLAIVVPGVSLDQHVTTSLDLILGVQSGENP